MKMVISQMDKRRLMRRIAKARLRPTARAMNYFNPKTSIITIVLMLVIGLSLGAQPFPIRVLGNGDNVYVNSTDVDNEGNIYITGSVAPYVQVRFDPCGLPITYGDGASGTRIFTAKLNPSGSNVLWMVTSSTQPYGNIFAGTLYKIKYQT